MATLRTFTARITGIDNGDRYPCEASLVLDKLSELRKSPRMQNSTLLTPSRYPGADAAQMFERDSFPSVFSFGNDLLGYDVINIGREAVLSAGQFPELSASSSRPLPLQFGAKTPVAVANSFYGVTGVGSAIRIRSDVGDTKVDAKPFVHFPKTRLFHVAGDSQIPLAAMVNKIGLALALLELFDRQ